MAAPNYLIDTLYYTLASPNTVAFSPYLAPESPYSGITVLHMSNNQYQTDPTKKLTCTGYRLTVSGSIFPSPQYNETYSIESPVGTLVATSTYDDSGTGLPTTVPSVRFQVLSGLDHYAYATSILISYNNSVTPGTRIMQIYGYP